MSLDERLQEPIEQLAKLTDSVDGLTLELNNKVSNHDLFNHLRNKAEHGKVKTLEDNLVSINDYVAQLPALFADKVENDMAHQLL